MDENGDYKKASMKLAPNFILDNVNGKFV